MPRTLKKALGQHFLTRAETCRPLVEFLRPDGERVLEIGSGAGALTQALLAAGASVAAWEVDTRWAVEVASRFRSERLAVVVGDAIEIPWDRLAAGTLVAGNLPYNVATAIVLASLESTLGRSDGIERAAFMVQLEVAERLAAQPGQSAYGSLSVLVGALARVEVLGRVPPGAFHPPPKVESAVVGLTPHRVLGRSEYEGLKPFVRSAFALRRKTIRNSLAADLGVAMATRLVEISGLPLNTRAESLDLETLRRLHAQLLELRRNAP